MAGGKLTPRQKMINMMYLVLTALLALNVSADILKSFQTIANSLKMTAEQMNSKNDELTKGLYWVLDDQSKKGKNEKQYLRPVIEEVEKEADKTVKALEFYLKRIESDSIAGYDTVTKTLIAADEGTKSYRYWMKLEGDEAANGGRGSGEARKLKDRMNNFVKWANDIQYKMIDEHPNIEEKKSKPAKQNIYKDLCVDPKNDPTVPNSSDMRNKTWEYYTFHGAPAIANIALLQKFKTDVRVIESSILEFIKHRIADEIIFPINELRTVVAPESNRILMGRDFKAQVFVTMSLKGPAEKAPRFTGSGITVTPDPRDRTVANAKAKSNPAVLKGKDSEGIQEYVVNAQVAQADGSYKTLKPVKGTFTVVRPDFEIGAIRLPKLYRDCRNELVVRSSALGTDFNPVFEVSGGESQQHPSVKTKFAIFPTSGNLKIQVFNKFDGDKLRLGEQAFQAIAPPAPEIKIKVNSLEWNPNMKIDGSAKVQLYAKADGLFHDELPKDARYQIESVTIKKKCGIGPFEGVGKSGPGEIGANGKLEINMGKYNIDRGCRVLFEIEKVSRVNYKDAKLEVTGQIGKLQKMIQGNVE